MNILQLIAPSVSDIIMLGNQIQPDCLVWQLLKMPGLIMALLTSPVILLAVITPQKCIFGLKLDLKCHGLKCVLVSLKGI